ncbi:hypothetical protein ACO2Q0_20285 [Phenylobacterium sp. VNQ135]|uniref:hypothetical protein n=1 Tax=Phenylobacterium sp. VNQ135 TaxID=3400922 RepID=UPI003C0BE4D6
MDHALVAAHGKMVALVASVLHAAGITTTDEFARLLKVFADTVGEADAQEAEILTLWSETVAALLPENRTH